MCFAKYNRSIERKDLKPETLGLTLAEGKAILKDIQTGKFISAWIQECKAGQPRFKATRRVNDAHPIEAVGEKLRGMMPWIAKNKLVDKARN